MVEKVLEHVGSNEALLGALVSRGYTEQQANDMLRYLEARQNNPNASMPPSLNGLANDVRALEHGLEKVMGPGLRMRRVSIRMGSAPSFRLSELSPVQLGQVVKEAEPFLLTGKQLLSISQAEQPASNLFEAVQRLHQAAQREAAGPEPPRTYSYTEDSFILEMRRHGYTLNQAREIMGILKQEAGKHQPAAPLGAGEADVRAVTERLVALGFTEQQAQEVIILGNADLFSRQWLRQPADAIVPITSNDFRLLDSTTARVIINGRPYVIGFSNPVNSAFEARNSIADLSNISGIRTGADGHSVSFEEFRAARGY